MNMETILGLVAGMLTTFSFLMQVVKTWRSKSAPDISLGMYIILSTGLILWLVYGAYIAALPVVLSNAAVLGLTCIILIQKLKYR